MASTLQAVTPVGTFTRKTNSAYKFVTVWASPRAMRACADAGPSGGVRFGGGVYARWTKDLGYGVTWHFTRPSPKSYGWDSAATLVGVFEVAA